MAQSKAPGSAAHQPTKAKAPAAKGTTSQQDRAIEAAIRAKLAKSKIKKDGFTVRVQGGIAYWDGTTSVIQHKGSATRMAKAAGARAVVNNIKISDVARQRLRRIWIRAAGGANQAQRTEDGTLAVAPVVYTFVLR